MNQADTLRALNFLRLDVPDYGRIASVKGQHYYDNNPYYQKDLPDYHPFDYFQVTLSGGMHPDYVDERNEDRFYEYKITMQDSIKRACETQIGACSVMMNDSGGFDVAFNKMLGESMKITRRQLRRLINEVRIKPYVPDLPSEDMRSKHDDLAKGETSKASADVIAQTFGYPEDRSYSTDLKDYDEVGMIPAAELDNDQMIQYAVITYEMEYLQPMFASIPHYSIEMHLINKKSKLTDAEFDLFMKELAAEIFKKETSVYGPAIFTNQVTNTQLTKGDAINRIYHELRRRGGLV